VDITRFLHDLVTSTSKHGISTRLFDDPGLKSKPATPWQQRFGGGVVAQSDVKEPMTRAEVKQARLRDGTTMMQNPMSGPKMTPKKGTFRL
jgi:hypothetical protein